MSNFEFPTNIRQIGNVNDGLRIYVEDYVCSFLQQYAQLGGYDEKVAILVGRYLTIDTQPVLFISGAIQGRFSIEDEGIMVFSDKTREYVAQQMDKYFPSLEVVGWMQSQPSYGTFLNPGYQKYHLENFKQPYQVLFVTDPIERLSSFYILDSEKEELKEAKGYFIYYEKNKSMHEYMLDNKISEVTLQEKAVSAAAEIDEEDKNGEESFSSKIKTASVRTARRPNTERDIIKRQSVRKRKTSAEQKRTVNMLTSLCAVMVLVCFIMGAGLIRSEEKITQLEENLVTLNTAYRNMRASLQQNEAVFAAQDTNPSEETPQAVVLEEDGNKLLAESENTGDYSEVIEAAAMAQEPVVDTPQAAAQAAAQDNTYTELPDTYIVQQGDSLSGISRKFYGNTTMVDKIMEANNMDDPDKIYFGKILILPK